MKERIEKKLRENLAISNLEIVNQSHLHQGHAGDNGTGETHFQINIAAQELEGKSRIEAHRIINSLLKNEFEENGLHALQIVVSRRSSVDS